MSLRIEIIIFLISLAWALNVVFTLWDFFQRRVPVGGEGFLTCFLNGLLPVSFR